MKKCIKQKDLPLLLALFFVAPLHRRRRFLMIMRAQLIIVL